MRSRCGADRIGLANRAPVCTWYHPGIRFVRDYNHGQSYAVVGLAAGSGQQTQLSDVRNGSYRDAVTGTEVTVSNGELSFFVQRASAGIYVLDGPGKIGRDGPFLR